MTQVRDAARDRGLGEELPRAVAINYAKLLAYKDEYEVARLFTDGRFEQQLRDQFDGDFKISFNLAPPLLGGERTRWGGRRSAPSAPGCCRCFGCSRRCAACAARRSISSAIAPIAGSSAI